MKFVKAVLFCFLILVSVCRVSVVAEIVNTGVVGELVAAESFDNGIIVFSTPEFSVGFDLNGDGDTSDYVIRYYNVSSGVTTNTTAVGENPAVGGSIIAFTTYEGYIGEDLNNDTDTNDYILRYYDLVSGMTENTGEFGFEPVVDDGVIVFFVAEDWLDKDLNGDGNKVDRFIWYYNVSSGMTFNATTISGTYPSKCGDIIAFVTDERWDNIDLNSDGDALDSVIRYYDMSTDTIINTTAVGYEPSIDGNIIAFYTEESSVGEDLNGNGDMFDRIIRYYDVSSDTIVNTGAFGEFPSVEGEIIAFETWEPDFGEDVNGDGDTDDMIIRYYNVLSGLVATTAEMGFYASVDGRKIAFATYESYLDEDVNGDGDKSDTIIRYCSAIFQGDLILDDNDVYIIEGEFTINGSIIVTENATLIIRNAIVNFTQTSNWQRNMTLKNPLNGNPRLQVTNVTITSNYAYSINLNSGSFANVSDSQFIGSSGAYCWLWVYGASSSAYFHNLTVHGVSNSGCFNFFLSDSSIVNLNVYSGNLSANGCDITTANTYGSGIISLDKCTLYATQAFDQSQQHIFNSTITRIVTHRETSVRLVNSTFTECFLYNQSRVYVFWYLDVHVIDKLSQNVSSANVTAAYPDTTVAESTLTGVDGWARLTLMEKMLNVTGEYPVGNYNVTATYDTYSNQTKVNMTGNQEVAITLPFIVPEFPAFFIMPLFMIATLAVVLVFRKRRTSF